MSPWGPLRERDPHAVEDMDRPDCDLQRLNRSYARFPVVNYLLSGWHRTYRERLRPILETRGSATVLDVGCGGGDVARSLARWAAKDGYELQVTGIDPDERANGFAVRAPAVKGVSYRRAHTSELVAEGLAFDVVLSNHVLHHLNPEQLAGMLRDSEALSSGIVLHNDLKRSNLSYALFAAGFWPLGLGSFICGDGLTSIARSYTAPELRNAAPARWTVEGNGPWHHFLVYRRDEPL
ncbi:class I SAM-dependent methyltransferase [Paenarthrobacter ureafaciens]|uniref:class I SAM-dependent methyltransferase n=1 Tax=Paenarthrobacter TaxID=1742992 RepID=UPI0022306825|nr:class I SAM-dependent methyltransferase [Paenarthrobacter sp. PAE-2]MCW3766262.1 class I SAM-dependent methyltransferase [Paenarthrobacter sp. PAE-2]